MLRDKAVWISILLLFSSAIFFGVAAFSPIFWLRRIHHIVISSFFNNAEPGLLCLSLLIIGGLWFVTSKYLIAYAKNQNARIIVICLVALTTLVGVVGSVVGVVTTVGWTTSSTELAGNRYHLENQSGSEISFYKLFKCDQADFDCKQISSFSSNGWSINSKLVANSETNSISIVVDGETIYTYTPE